MKSKLFFGYHFPMAVYWKNYEKGGFTQLSLDFSSRCNYRCDWCFNLHLLNGSESNTLLLNERVQLMEKAVVLGVRTLVVPGTGEPTLDPMFQETIEAANRLGLITVVYSNLTGRVNEKVVRFMFDHNVSIGIKLDSFEEEHFTSRYHTTTSKYQEYRRNLETVLEIYRRSEKVVDGGVAHRVIVNTVLTKENLPEINNISSFCQDNNIPLFIRPVKSVEWAKNSPVLWKKLGNRFGLNLPEEELLQAAKRVNTLFSPSSTVENHCAIFSFGLTVKADGDVQLCPDHHESRGVFNIKRNSLEEIMLGLKSRRKVESGYCVMLEGIQH